jgi:hypothetical protein
MSSNGKQNRRPKKAQPVKEEIVTTKIVQPVKFPKVPRRETTSYAPIALRTVSRQQMQEQNQKNYQRALQARPKIISKANRLTQAGKDFLLTALNPFPDDGNPPRISYPDGTVGVSVPGYFKQQLQISAPTGVTGNWDCHIGNYPFQLGLPALTTAHRDYLGRVINSVWNGAVGVGGTAVANGPIFIHTAAAGGATFPYTTTTAPWTPPTGFTAQSINWDSAISDPSRVVAFGFEVVNTTAAINAQGSVTTYRMPQETRDQLAALTYFVGSGSSVAPLASTSLGMMPPPTLAFAEQLRSAQTWAASEGCYCTGVLSQGSNNPFEASTYVTPGIMALSSAGNSDNGVLTDMLIQNPGVFLNSSGNVADTVLSAGSNARPMHFDSVGAYFAGLSNATTLTLTVHVFYEMRPAPESTLINLAQPVAPLDQAAIDIYKKVARSLPPACKVADNASGDWFRKIVSFVSQASKIVGSTLGFIPGVSMGASVVGGIADAIDGAMSKRPS